MKKLLVLAISLFSLSANAANCGVFVDGQALLERSNVESVNLNGDSNQIKAHRAKWHNMGLVVGFTTGITMLDPEGDFAKKLGSHEGSTRIYLRTLEVCQENQTKTFTEAMIIAIQSLIKEE